MIGIRRAVYIPHPDTFPHAVSCLRSTHFAHFTLILATFFCPYTDGACKDGELWLSVKITFIDKKTPWKKPRGDLPAGYGGMIRAAVAGGCGATCRMLRLNDTNISIL